MQINRLFEIIYVLLDKSTVTAKELSERFEVSQRTIYRDVETLSFAGIPIYMSKGKGGGISLLPEFVLNKAVLSENEKSEILSALQGFSAVNQFDESGTLSKLGAMFGEHNTNWIEVDFSGWFNQEEVGKLFAALKQAILGKKVVQFDYHNSNRESGNRTAEPLRLLFKGQSWYLFAYCKNKNDTRLFKLSRIKNFVVLDETFTRNYIPTVFNESWGFQDEFIELKLKIDKKMAYRVYDEFDNNGIITDPDDNFIVTINYPKGEWILPYLMSYGENLEVLAPSEIREEIMQKLKEMSEKYS